MHFEYQIEGGNFTRAGFASSEIKKKLKQLNVDLGIVKRTVVATYEAEVNVVAHAYSGTIYVDFDEEKVVIRLVDEGPGIPDIEQAMKEGFSTASSTVREMGFGAGMGLPNMKKNADDLQVSSEVGKGTTVQITMHYQNPNNK
ncbi:MAG: anti-sigma regulatory factor [Bacteroidetes bacterium]|nr:MAG: anti-sigma regulatory factor [Bacteroidota bacterium]